MSDATQTLLHTMLGEHLSEGEADDLVDIANTRSLDAGSALVEAGAPSDDDLEVLDEVWGA